MALITRLVTNAGAPLCAPDGALLANAQIIFLLVNKVGMPADAWDAVTNERIGGHPVIVTTDANGEFGVELWPNSRGDRVTRYHCTVQHPGFRAFYGVVEESAEPLSWAYFMANGGPLSPQEISQLQQYLADMNAAKNAAESAVTASAQSAVEATGQADMAMGYKNAAGLYAATATDKAAEASASASTATAKAAEAVVSAAGAANSAAAASGSATSAGVFAGAAATSAASMSASVSAAEASAADAYTSALGAAASATTATTKAGEAATSAAAAATAQSGAEQAAATAGGHASTAQQGATTATGKASEATTAAAQAVAAQQAADSAVGALVASPSVDTIVVLTQAAYDAITPVAGTLYVVQG